MHAMQKNNTQHCTAVAKFAKICFARHMLHTAVPDCMPCNRLFPQDCTFCRSYLNWTTYFTNRFITLNCLMALIAHYIDTTVQSDISIYSPFPKLLTINFSLWYLVPSYQVKRFAESVNGKKSSGGLGHDFSILELVSIYWSVYFSVVSIFWPVYFLMEIILFIFYGEHILVRVLQGILISKLT